ncbi:tetratricopeptide repeat protein [Kitasatospora sp. KL5]|uniref:tetratricopeptide repeat protein n=1 Tax=Kitasatospora sp. KL5 TaxID=3425125 RepID=UPI003D6FF9CA
MNSHALEALRTSPDLAELAAYPFNVDLDRADHLEAVHLASGVPIEAWAGDDTGGTYFHCEGGQVLYASSDGSAGLIGDSIDEALETLIGLPCWHDLLHHIPPDADDDTLTAAVTEEELSEFYGPELDADRSRLLAALGLRELPAPVLVRRLHRALLRTEPDFLLLNSQEGLAHGLLDGLPRLPLWQTVLAPGQADLAALRADRTPVATVAADPARREGVLWAARYDRNPDDTSMLRALLGESTRPEPGYEPEYGAAQDGREPFAEPPLTWAALARRQGRTELARAALIRLLDDAGPRDASLLDGLAVEFAALGDHPQAARARWLFASLQDDPGQRAAALTDLAAHQRRAGDTDAAARTLKQAEALTGGEVMHDC